MTTARQAVTGLDAGAQMFDALHVIAGGYGYPDAARQFRQLFLFTEFAASVIAAKEKP